MLFFQTLIAHGALGWADELVFAGIIFLFLAMMGIQWVKARNTEFEDTPSPVDVDTSDVETTDTGDRFRLD
jgi:hypothetical protein